jgi:hypothetical protein
MTDRDTFAAAALTGLLSGRPQPYNTENREAFAELAWIIADAMLSARGTTSDHDAAPPASSVTLTDAEREALAAQPATWVEEEIACYQAFDRSGAPWDWPDDEPATVTRMSLSMSAECVRLRDEVDRLRLTDAEREALRRVLRRWRECFYGSETTDAEHVGAVIDGLLARAAKEDDA